MAINTARNSFRNLSRKVTAPTFRIGIGEVYRELEEQGKIPAEGIERKAKYEEAKAARAKAQQSAGNPLSRLAAWFSDQFD